MTIMTRNVWYKTIVEDERIDLVDDAVNYFENELEEAKKECNITGSIEQSAARLPGFFEYRFAQLQEIEAILEHLHIELKRLRSLEFKNYRESYNTELSARDIDKYVDGEESVVIWLKLINKFALIRNQYLGTTKSLDHKNWQISNITRMRVAGLDDAAI